MSRRSCACIELGRPAVTLTVPRLDGGRRPARPSSMPICGFHDAISPGRGG